MSWNDASGSKDSGRRVRRIVIGAAGVALIAFAIVLATRQYNAHAPGESPPPPTISQQNAAALAAAREAGVRPAAATAQNLIPGAIAPDAIGSPLPATGAGSVGVGASGAAANGQSAVPLTLGGSAGATGAGAMTYPTAPRPQGTVGTLALPFPAARPSSSLAPSMTPPGRAGAGPGMTGSPGGGGPH